MGAGLLPSCFPQHQARRLLWQRRTGRRSPTETSGDKTFICEETLWGIWPSVWNSVFVLHGFCLYGMGKDIVEWTFVSVHAIGTPHLILRPLIHKRQVI